MTSQSLAGASHYDVTVTSQDDKAFAPGALVTSQAQIVLENLDWGTTYDVIITAVSESDERSVESEIVTESTSKFDCLNRGKILISLFIPVPPNPANPIVADVTDNSVTLEWAEAKGGNCVCRG